MVDQVKVVADEQAPTEQSLRRNLTNRHIQLIAIGGAIGTGLFMGSGKTISLAGPSIIFVYMIIGFMLFFVMRAMGELLLSNLEYKSFSDFAADLLGPWAGYFTGWTYWFCWVVTGMADVVAITAYAQFWFPAAASLINFVVLTSAASSANSGVFSTSRMLFGLAQDGQAPKMFAKLSKRAVPAKGLTFSCMCLLGGVVMLMVNPSVIAAFTMITTVSAILFMFVWTIILCSYLVYRKKRPQLHEQSKYKMPLGKLMCWVCMAFFAFVLVLLTLEADTREALMVTPLWFVLLGAGWLFAGKKRLAK